NIEMRIKETNKERLVIVHSDRKKEWTMGFGISLIGLIPFFLHTEDWFLWVGKFVFWMMFALIGLLNCRDEYTISFDKADGNAIIAYRNIIDIIRRAVGNKIVLPLERCSHVFVKEEVHEKKKMHRVMLYLDGISIPLTDTLYFHTQFPEELAKGINQWLKTNQVGRKFGAIGGQDADDDDDNNGAGRTLPDTLKKRGVASVN
ncbi:hypothetical protein SAMD00019534_083650, partial [Acytostelium subglobosum LB1]|uniref:hypothetical protein n=1 Tax=Acytostelium subglobosum LB1 TaxID=1410327 RepID=UPI0006451C4E